MVVLSEYIFPIVYSYNYTLIRTCRMFWIMQLYLILLQVVFYFNILQCIATKIKSLLIKWSALLRLWNILGFVLLSVLLFIKIIIDHS